MIRFLPALLLFLLALWVIDLANRGGHNALLGVLLSLPGGDKIGHFFVYGLLAAFLDAALRWRMWSLRGGLSAPAAAVWVLGFGLVEEASQFFTQTRTPDAVDLLANLAGVWVCCLLGRRLARRLGHLKA